jgi:hypothetical protein
LVIISVFVLEEVQQVVHPEEGLLVRAVSVPCHENVIIPILLDSKVVAR